jgi:hypothetical protein
MSIPQSVQDLIKRFDENSANLQWDPMEKEVDEKIYYDQLFPL